MERWDWKQCVAGWYALCLLPSVCAHTHSVMHMQRSKLIFSKLWYVPEAFWCSSQLSYWFSCPRGCVLTIHGEHSPPQKSVPFCSCWDNFLHCLLEAERLNWLFFNCLRVIYKCSCEMVFNKKKLLQEHFQQNTSKLLVGVFKCPQCQLVYMQKQQLMQHVKVGNSLPYWYKILLFEFTENFYQPSGWGKWFKWKILEKYLSRKYRVQDLEMSVEWFVLVGLNTGSSSHLDAF